MERSFGGPKSNDKDKARSRYQLNLLTEENGLIPIDEKAVRGVMNCQVVCLQLSE